MRAFNVSASLAAALLAFIAYKVLCPIVPSSLDRAEAELSPSAKQLLDQVFQNIDPGHVIDGHVHIACLGDPERGDADACHVHPNALNRWLPHHWLKGKAFMAGFGIAAYDTDEVDSKAVRIMVERFRHLRPAGSARHGRALVLAFDKHYRPDGSVDEAKTGFYVPNDYVIGLAEQHPAVLLPAASIHPYRSDALEELQRVAGLGVKVIKWLPNAHGMDPSDPRCDAFYDMLIRYNMTLLTHVGFETAVNFGGGLDQSLGNPLLLRRPLDRGVRIIMAHCASQGDDDDIENGGVRRSSFELFARLFNDERYKSHLWADISAMTTFMRVLNPSLRSAITTSEWHPRLLYGSDYVIPCIFPLVSTFQHWAMGYIDWESKRALDEIFDYNPVLFDFALKRKLQIASSSWGAQVFANTQVWSTILK